MPIRPSRPYELEIVSDGPRALGGDGGCNICGGAGFSSGGCRSPPPFAILTAGQLSPTRISPTIITACGAPFPSIEGSVVSTAGAYSAEQAYALSFSSLPGLTDKCPVRVQRCGK